MQGIEKFNKDLAAQTKLDNSRRRAEAPAYPKPLSERPQETMLTVEQDRAEAMGSIPVRV